MTYDEVRGTTVRGTAPLEPSPEQLARAQEHRVLPDIPKSLSDPELRLIRRPPRSPAADSYRSQQYYFRDKGSHYVLAPERPGIEPGPSTQPSFELPVHFISNWHKGSAATTFAECLTAQEELCARLAELDLGFQLAIAVAEDRTWFEGFSLVAGLHDEQVVELARAPGQPAAIRLAVERSACRRVTRTRRLHRRLVAAVEPAR